MTDIKESSWKGITAADAAAVNQRIANYFQQPDRELSQEEQEQIARSLSIVFLANDLSRIREVVQLIASANTKQAEVPVSDGTGALDPVHRWLVRAWALIHIAEQCSSYLTAGSQEEIGILLEEIRSETEMVLSRRNTQRIRHRFGGAGPPGLPK